MKKDFLIVGLLILAFSVNGQTFKIQSGITSSSLNWKIENGSIDNFDQKLIGHSILIGIDYLERKYFNLSSNVGLVRKGGTSSNLLSHDPYGQPLVGVKQKATLDYLTINTTLDLKYPIKEKLFPFIGFGPRLDYLISSSHNFDSLKDRKELSKCVYGLNVGAGVKFRFTRIELGIGGDYLVNLNNISDYQNLNDNQEIKDKTFLFSLIFGYKL